ncbi:MAG TPA: CBS domain-containing protein, partial [Pirellulales bacterium]|nr:CBS domain-containing protein [Pirellulales bacterium]
MLEHLLIPDIRELIEAGDLACLSDVLNSWLPADVAALITGLTGDEQVTVFHTLRPERSVKVFEHLNLDTQTWLLSQLPDSETAELLNRMAPDDRTALLGELPDEQSRRMLGLLSPEERGVAEALLKQDPSSVGRLMTPDYIAVGLDWTIERVLDHVRTHGKDSETLNVIYVVDDEGKLIDDLRIREILLAPLHERVADLADKKFVALRTTDLRRDVVEVFRKYDRTALPV